MQKLSALILSIIICASSFAQLSKGGTPSASGFQGGWENVPLYKMPPLDVARLLAEDDIPDPEMKKPIRFGKAQKVSIVPDIHKGKWETLPDGMLAWQQRIKSAGAFSLSLGFCKMALPPGGKLFIYNKDHTIVLGAFTNELAYADNILATEQLNGDEVMVEYDVPVRHAGLAPFELCRVSHDYKDINKILKSFGLAGACQININCPLGAGYQDVKKGVAAIIASGSELCTGTLVTTTNNSGIPYFLTANHCYNGSSNVASWVFRFNWESPTCANPSSSPAYQSVSGSTLKAKSANTDFCLVQLATAPPNNYDVRYAGWDRSGIAATSQAGISHPSIDIKKICTAESVATTATYGSATCWQTGTWVNGCTEPGSSGSALFDQNHRVVGQLFGGPSACGETAANMHDFYGKFSVSWDGDGTDATRLKTWLDPGNLNSLTTDVFNPNISYAYDAKVDVVNNPLAADNCNTTFSPSVTIANKGTTTLTSVTVYYRVDGGALSSTAWSGSLALNATAVVSLPGFSASAGTHTFVAYTSLPNNHADDYPVNDTATRIFTVLNTSPQSLPFNEGFEGTAFPPTGWTLQNPDGATTWQQATTGATGSKSAFKNNFNSNDVGQEDYLISPFFSFPGSGSYGLSFAVAYANYDANYHDTLRVEVSADCGATWSTVYKKGGDNLATAPNTTASFVPTAAQWRRDTVSLDAYRTMGPLRIRLVNKSGYSNNLYLDDVNLTGCTPPATVSGFGSNQWNVNVWNAGGANLNANSWSANYSGYYTSSVLNINTQNDWGANGTPSDAAGYTGCAVAIDNHSYSAKRHGFPCGYYQLDVPYHDDAAQLFINGTKVWEHDGCCDTHINVWSGWLGSNDSAEYRVTEGSGQSYGFLTFNATADTLYTWLGTVSTDWDNSANWGCGMVPPAGSNVIIPNMATLPVLTTDKTIGSLKLEGKLTLNGKTLNINGAVTGDGTFTGSATSTLIIGGNAGILSFTPGSAILYALTIKTGATATVGGNLLITKP